MNAILAKFNTVRYAAIQNIIVYRPIWRQKQQNHKQCFYHPPGSTTCVYVFTCVYSYFIMIDKKKPCQRKLGTIA